MAMNKKEKAYVASLEEQLAFRRTEPVEKDVMHPTTGSYGELSTGYAFNSYNMTVTEACSSSVSHGYDSHTKTHSQRPIMMFSTKVKALKAMRYELEQKYTRSLHKVDQLIKIEEESHDA